MAPKRTDDPDPDDEKPDDEKPADKGGDKSIEAQLAEQKAETDKWKAQARKHEERAKANAEAAARVKDLEDKDKTESQRLTDKATEAEKRAAEAERRATAAENLSLRLEVGGRKGLTPVQARRLVGDDEAALEADADELIASFKGDGAKDNSKDRRPAPTKPTPALKGGDAPDDEPEETDPRKLIEQVPR